MPIFTSRQLDLLFKLWRKKCFGKGHMLIDNLVGGFGKQKKGQMRDEVEELLRKNILILKPTTHGHSVYINLDYRKIIEKALKTNYSFL